MKTGSVPCRPIPESAWIVLALSLVAAAWWRGHTFGPAFLDRTGIPLWPVIEGESEPLDCDESAYAYMGRRMNQGAVLYRDLAENKPPGGYWLYALATWIGGANEWTIRLMPIPIVLATLFMLWRIGLDLASPAVACLAPILYAILATDPYLYGNGAQLELPLNLLSIASLAALLRASGPRRAAWLFLAGSLVASATLIRQTAALNLPVYALLAWTSAAGAESRARHRLLDLLALAAGFVLILLSAAAVLVAQGAGPAAFENIFVAGTALVTDTPPPPHAPPLWTRWLTGNSDPRNGSLPPPFGKTDWLVWWGTGSWPLWIPAAAALPWCWWVRPTPARRALVMWTLSSLVQLVAPRQFWAHYYLLPTPGIAVLVSLLVVDLTQLARAASRSRRHARALAAALAALLVLASIAQTVVIQVRDYLLVPSELLAARYKGGRQWIRLRQISRDLAARTREWPDASLFVWGWQSPLYLYSGLDAPTRHFFANDLVKAHADKSHPLVQRWTREILHDLERDHPTLIFTGDPPFPSLQTFLSDHYQLSRVVRDAPVLWVERSRFRAFEATPRYVIPRPRLLPSPDRELGVWAWLPDALPRGPQAVPAPITRAGDPRSRPSIEFDRHR
jgi:4-amino-4-deoxy-L-arabinose transferase-like glycosyltransferase